MSKTLSVGGIENPLWETVMDSTLKPVHDYVKDSTSGLYLPFSVDLTGSPFGYTTGDVSADTTPFSLDRMVRLSLAFPKFGDMLDAQKVPLVNISTDRLLEILKKKGE